MNSVDQQLLDLLKETAGKHGYTPDAFLSLASSAAEWNSRAVIPNVGPYPTSIDEANIDRDALAAWPDWVSSWVTPGSKWERLHWPDGSVTIRLVNHRALVLGAAHLPREGATSK